MTLSRWLTWTPSKGQIKEKHPEPEPAKPPKPGFAGFAGSGHEPSCNIGQPAGMLRSAGPPTKTSDCPSQRCLHIARVVEASRYTATTVGMSVIRAG